MVDYDDNDIEDCDEALYLHIIVPSACGSIILVTFLILVVVAWSVYDRRHACDSVFKYIKKQLEIERNREPFNKMIYDDLNDMFQQVLDVKKKIAGFEEKKSRRVVRNKADNQPNAIEMRRLQEVEGGGGGGGGGGEGRGAEDEAEEDLNPQEGGPTADGGIKSDGRTSAVDGKLSSCFYVYGVISE